MSARVKSVSQRSGWLMVHAADLNTAGSVRAWCGVCGEPVDRVEYWERQGRLGEYIIDWVMVALPCGHTTEDVEGDGALFWLKRLAPGPRELVP